MLVIKNGEIYLFWHVAHEYFDTDSSCKTCATENTKHITECVYLREMEFTNRDVWKYVQLFGHGKKTEAVSGKLHAILNKKDWIKCRTIDDSSAVWLQVANISLPLNRLLTQLQNMLKFYYIEYVFHIWFSSCHSIRNISAEHAFFVLSHTTIKWIFK